MRISSTCSVKNQQGMTLIEVIIALGIFATAALALLNSLGSQMSAVDHFRTSLFASWVAENTLIETQIKAEKKEKRRVTLAGQEWFVEQQHTLDRENNISQNQVRVLQVEDALSPILSVSRWTQIMAEKP
ncbi:MULTISPECIES: type II secretion system minor pseudopilin GspI [Rahnella]|uniref:type II secretion system minor pseudopilin GspI n=1 Tax=Rahnella TaxID=34037 RepID=UPI00055E0130|nr:MULTISPECIES: type II secretion system minor pseudopilin GspI [Rahnella]QQN34348.1 type II secretion system minor pseudopilin GspI [Rahnella aceris]